MLRVLASAASAFALEGCASLAGTAARFDAAELTANPTLLIATTRKPVNGAREALVRVGPCRPHEHRPGKACRTGRGTFFARFDRSGRLAHRNDRDGAENRRSARPAAGMRDVLLYVHGSTRRSRRRHSTPPASEWYSLSRGDDGVFLAVEGTAVRLWLRSRKRHVVARCPRTGALELDHEPRSRARPYRRAQRGHDVDDGGDPPDLRPARGHRRGTIGTVVFASPDIDMDVFSSSVERIGPFASNITVITSTNDRALAVSRWIAGGITRVGAAEQAVLKRLGLHVSMPRNGLGLINHDLFLSMRRSAGHPPRHRRATHAGGRWN